MKKLLISALVGFGAIYSASSASAAITFEFDTVLTGSPAGSTPWARLTIESVGIDTVSLTLENTSSLPAADGQAISKLLLNVDPFISGSLSSLSSKLSSWEYKEDGFNDVSAHFDLSINFVTALGNRFLPGDSVVMTATGSGLTEDSFNALSNSGGDEYLGLVHLISIPPNGDSAKVTPVPEPASMIALGLGAVALVRRKKRK